MALPSGTRLGPYEIQAPIGAGGMGEVYRARDTNLDRTVALKVLPPACTSDPERTARFEREAKVLASLNHPNIAHVYGFEASAIAMEFVDGQTLAEIIRQAGRLPLDRSMAIIRQVAAGLEAAHEQGIVHRDLKPANIKVREDGTVKVLDFGLAKALGPDSGGGAADQASSPTTLTARMTEIGMILGTAAYMAPEQAKGKVVDRRADVWAFGVVLFEMLAGRRAFDGDDVSEVLAAVLKLEPEWSALPPDLPGPVRRLLKRCLEKDPKRRLRDVAEGMLQLEEGLATGETSSSLRPLDASVTSKAGGATMPLWRRMLPLFGAALAGAAIMFGVSRWRAAPVTRPTLIRFLHEPAQSAPLFMSANDQDIAIAPDGQSLVYVQSTGSRSLPPALWVRRLDQLEAAPLRGGEGAQGPFVSRDNAWVGFVDGTGDSTALKKVSILGGPPVLLTRAPGPVVGATWTDDHSIVLGVRANPLGIISDGGGEFKPLTTLDASAGEQDHLWPSAVPGTPVVLFTIGFLTSAPGAGGQLAAVDRATGRTVRLKIPGSHARYVPTGHIVYGAIDGSVRAIAFDPKTMTTAGNPLPVVEAVGMKLSGAMDFDVADDGRLVYVPGGSTALASVMRTLSWVDATGKDTAIAAPPRSYFYVRLSPDGTRVSTDVRDQASNVWIWDLARDALLRLTDKPGVYQYCLWAPDGEHVVFTSIAGAGTELMRMRADGTGPMEQMTDARKDRLTPFPNTITPDGKYVIFRATVSGQLDNLYIASLTGDRTVKPLLATEHTERNATISPDGHWMAFESDLSGHLEIYVRPFPNVDSGQFSISTAGGVKPVWSPTGHEIFYVSPDSKMMAVPVKTVPGFAAGRPAALFDLAPYFLGGAGVNFDVSRDGKRFVMIRNPANAPGRSLAIAVVVNWADELRERFTAK